MEIWHCFLGPKPQASILESLRQTGLHSYDYQSLGRRGPGIVFFDEASVQLLDLLRETSRRGVERVLAIQLSPNAIEPATSGPFPRMQRIRCGHAVTSQEQILLINS